MDFTQIKDSGKKVTLVWNTTDAKGATIEHSLSGVERPLKEFRVALQAFGPLVARACDLSKENSENLTVRSVALKTTDDEARGVVVTVSIAVSGGKAPMTLNTPFLKEKAEGSEGGPGFYDDAWVACIHELEAAATLYHNGEREQVEMFD